MREDPEEVARIRKLLKAWDEGVCTLGEFEMMITRPFKQTLFDCVKKGEPYGEASFGCILRDEIKLEGDTFVPAEPEKAQKIDVEIELFPGGFWIRPK